MSSRSAIEELPTLGGPKLVFLVQATSEFFQPAVLLMASCGLAANEVLALRWRDVDLRNGTISVERRWREIRPGQRQLIGLGDEIRVVQLPSRVLEALERHRAAAGQTVEDAFVFPGGRPDAAVSSHVLEDACERARDRALSKMERVASLAALQPSHELIEAVADAKRHLQAVEPLLEAASKARGCAEGLLSSEAGESDEARRVLSEMCGYDEVNAMWARIENLVASPLST